MLKQMVGVLNKPGLVLLLLGLVMSCNASAKDLSVLILHSYHQEYPWTKTQHEAFVSSLNQHIGAATLSLATEHLDTKRKAFTPEYKQMFADYMSAKYGAAARDDRYRPDVIYVTDDNALRFANQHMQQQFPNVPLVFSGINDLGHKEHLSPLFNGMFEQPPIRQTMNLLQQLESGLDEVLFVGDGSATHYAMRAAIHQQAEKFFPAINLKYFENPIIENTTEQLRQQSAGVVVLTTIGGFRNAREQVVPLSKVVSLIRGAGDFRIFTVEDTYLMPGVVGGWLNSGSAQGTAAANVIYQLMLEQATTSDLSQVFPAVPVFDYPTLLDHGYDLQQLPDGSELRREPQTFYYRNLRLVWGTISLVLLQTLVIGFLIVNVRWRKRAEWVARQSEQRSRELIEGAPDSIFLSDQNGKLVMVNQYACDMLGVAQGDVVSKHIWELHRSGSREAYQQLCGTLAADEIRQFETEYQWGEGEKLPVDVRIRWLNWGDEKLILGFVRDITERKKVEAMLKLNEERLEFLAKHDPLTGLANRLLFQDRLEHATLLNERFETKVAILFLDLDRFKTINDTLGHETGDFLLQSVAERLLKCTRKMDTVARFGGDEFVVLLERIGNAEQVARIAVKILSALAAPITIGPKELRVTASIGISLFPQHGKTMEVLMQHADVAMYKAKAFGRNTFRFYQQSMSARASELLSLENDLHRAVELQQLQLYYQPQVDLTNGELIGLEALIRWLHPDLGLVSPADFIPLAEETGLIVGIGQWVLREACQQNSRWQRDGMRCVPVAVNISPRQFRQKNLVSMVAEALQESGLDSQWLELEITEGVLMEHTESARQTLEAFFQSGVRLVVDDFGSGYSSLSYLKRFPIHGLKIDREFIDELETDPHDAAIVATIVALARGLDLSVIAEGIENPHQTALLIQQGCLTGQGYYFGRPQPAQEVVKLLRPPS